MSCYLLWSARLWSVGRSRRTGASPSPWSASWAPAAWCAGRRKSPCWSWVWRRIYSECESWWIRSRKEERRSEPTKRRATVWILFFLFFPPPHRRRIVAVAMAVSAESCSPAAAASSPLARRRVERRPGGSSQASSLSVLFARPRKVPFAGWQFATPAGTGGETRGLTPRVRPRAMTNFYPGQIFKCSLTETTSCFRQQQRLVSTAHAASDGAFRASLSACISFFYSSCSRICPPAPPHNGATWSFWCFLFPLKQPTIYLLFSSLLHSYIQQVTRHFSKHFV